MSTKTGNKNIEDITIEDYSEKSFVLRGETRPYKDIIKSLGGKWNSKLRDGSGWVFASSKKEQIEKWIETGECIIKTPTRRRTSKGSEVKALETKIDSLKRQLTRMEKLMEQNTLQMTKFMQNYSEETGIPIESEEEEEIEVKDEVKDEVTEQSSLNDEDESPKRLLKPQSAGSLKPKKTKKTK